MRISKLFVLGAALVVLALAAGNNGQVGLAQSCTVTVNPGQSIQSAIDSVSANAVICLAAGRWQENLRITKDNLTLQGQGSSQTIVTGSFLIQVVGQFTVASLTLQSSNAAAAASAGMVLIPPGSFQMGDSLGDTDSILGELPVHTVNVSAFYMDVNDVTVGLWNKVVNWAQGHGYGYDLGPRSDLDNRDDNHPVVDVSWYEAVKWANARSEMQGLTPVYYTDSSQMTIYRRGGV